MQVDKAIPFLETPPMLDGSLAGDIAFDPVGFSNYFDIKWLREAELKHGRVCMLGVTGLLAQEFVTLPMFENGATPIDDFFVVPAFGLWQVFFAIGALEFFMNGFKISAGEPHPATRSTVRLSDMGGGGHTRGPSNLAMFVTRLMAERWESDWLLPACSRL